VRTALQVKNDTCQGGAQIRDKQEERGTVSNMLSNPPSIPAGTDDTTPRVRKGSSAAEKYDWEQATSTKRPTYR